MSDRKTYLVFDSRVISSVANVRLVPGSIQKAAANPLLCEDKPWEPRFDNVYPTVIRDPETGLYRLWYNTFIIDPLSSNTSRADRKRIPYEVGDREMGVCYAESRDGFEWKKPELGRIEFEGSTRNNLVMRNIHGTGVFFDSHDPDPKRRYKAFMQNGVAFSGDGLGWSPVRTCPGIQARGDTHNNALLYERTGEYIGITRLWKNEERVVGLTRSRDFLDWTKSGEILRGDRNHQTYSMPVIAFEDGLLGLVSIFHVEEDTVDCEWVWSPDSYRWHRLCPGLAAIPRGPEGSFDSGCIFAAAPLFEEERILLYYGANNGPHSGWRDGFLGRASLGANRIAGFTPTSREEAGVVITQPVECTGNRLYVNADISEGEMRVELLGLEGWGRGECRPPQGDLAECEVVWDSGRDLAPFRGKPIQVLFELRAASLYAFGFAG